MMPRPDLSRLGVRYRRIPVLSIGKDIYLDTRLIIQKLEEVNPSVPRLAVQGNEQRALQQLLQVLNIDSGLFSRASQLLPADLPLLSDPKWQKDRADFMGVNFSREGLAAVRPEALNEVVGAMELLETTLLADGRDWILKTETPSLADIEAIWPFHWLSGIPGALPPDQASEDQFPKVYAWIKRFQAAISAAKKQQPKVQTVIGEEAEALILNSPLHEGEGKVQPTDPLVQAEGLQAGHEVLVWPTDTGKSHKDVGKLVSLDSREVVIAVGPADSGPRVHAPRHGFRIRRSATKALM